LKNERLFCSMDYSRIRQEVCMKAYKVFNNKFKIANYNFKFNPIV